MLSSLLRCCSKVDLGRVDCDYGGPLANPAGPQAANRPSPPAAQAHHDQGNRSTSIQESCSGNTTAPCSRASTHAGSRPAAYCERQAHAASHDVALHASKVEPPAGALSGNPMLAAHNTSVAAPSTHPTSHAHATSGTWATDVCADAKPNLPQALHSNDTDCCPPSANNTITSSSLLAPTSGAVLCAGGMTAEPGSIALSTITMASLMGDPSMTSRPNSRMSEWAASGVNFGDLMKGNTYGAPLPTSPARNPWGLGPRYPVLGAGATIRPGMLGTGSGVSCHCLKMGCDGVGCPSTCHIAERGSEPYLWGSDVFVNTQPCLLTSCLASAASAAPVPPTPAAVHPCLHLDHTLQPCSMDRQGSVMGLGSRYDMPTMMTLRAMEDGVEHMGPPIHSMADSEAMSWLGAAFTASTSTHTHTACEDTMSLLAQSSAGAQAAPSLQELFSGGKCSGAQVALPPPERLSGGSCKEGATVENPESGSALTAAPPGAPDGPSPPPPPPPPCSTQALAQAQAQTQTSPSPRHKSQGSLKIHDVALQDHLAACMAATTAGPVSSLHLDLPPFHHMPLACSGLAPFSYGRLGTVPETATAPDQDTAIMSSSHAAGGRCPPPAVSPPTLHSDAATDGGYWMQGAEHQQPYNHISDGSICDNSSMDDESLILMPSSPVWERTPHGPPSPSLPLPTPPFPSCALLGGLQDTSGGGCSQSDMGVIELSSPKPVGKGSHGEVFMGMWQGRCVAVKVISLAPGHTPTPSAPPSDSNSFRHRPSNQPHLALAPSSLSSVTCTTSKSPPLLRIHNISIDSVELEGGSPAPTVALPPIPSIRTLPPSGPQSGGFQSCVPSSAASTVAAATSLPLDAVSHEVAVGMALRHPALCATLGACVVEGHGVPSARVLRQRGSDARSLEHTTVRTRAASTKPEAGGVRGLPHSCSWHHLASATQEGGIPTRLQSYGSFNGLAHSLKSPSSGGCRLSRPGSRASSSTQWGNLHLSNAAGIGISGSFCNTASFCSKAGRLSCVAEGVAAAASLPALEAYLVMEMCDGGSLRSALDSRRVRCEDVAEVLSLCWQICSAVEYMHGQGVLHGDLKASNVMLASAPTTDSGAAPEHADLGLVGLPLSGLSSSGGGKPKGSFQAKLADFGNSRLVESDSSPVCPGVPSPPAHLPDARTNPPAFLRSPPQSVSSVVNLKAEFLEPPFQRISQPSDARLGSSLTDATTSGLDGAGCPLTTPTHAAPELLSGGTTLWPGFDSDMYALGVVLWEVGTGQRPYNKLKHADLVTLKQIPTSDVLTFTKDALDRLPPDFPALCHDLWRPAGQRPTAAAVTARLTAMAAACQPPVRLQHRLPAPSPAPEPTPNQVWLGSSSSGEERCREGSDDEGGCNSGSRLMGAPRLTSRRTVAVIDKMRAAATSARALNGLVQQGHPEFQPQQQLLQGQCPAPDMEQAIGEAADLPSTAHIVPTLSPLAHLQHCKAFRVSGGAGAVDPPVYLHRTSQPGSLPSVTAGSFAERLVRALAAGLPQFAVFRPGMDEQRARAALSASASVSRLQALSNV